METGDPGDMTLADLSGLIRESWYLPLIGILLGLAAAGSYLALEPKQYEARLEIQLGKVQRPHGIEWIESHADVSRRISGEEFIDAVLDTLGWKGTVNASLLRSSISGFRNGLNVEVRLRAYSVDDGRKAGQVVGAAIISTHRELFRRSLAEQKVDFDSLEDGLEKLEAVMARLQDIGGRLPVGDYAGNILFLSVHHELSKELDHLRRKTSRKELLQVDVLQHASRQRLLNVDDQPVYPRARNIWWLGCVGGLLLGIFLVALKPYARKRGGRKDSADQI